MAKGEATGLYIPESITSENPQEIVAWVTRELSKISQAMEGIPARTFERAHVEPARPREAQVRHADGTDWNPGYGAGPYVRIGSNWVPMTVQNAAVLAALGYTPVNKAGDTMTGALKIPDGALATPSLANDGDVNTGLYFPADNEIALVTDGVARVRADSGGRVLLPGQPFVAARIVNSGTPQQFGVIIWNEAMLNIGNHYNGSTGVFTAPVTGSYLVAAHGIFGSGSIDMVVRKNGSNFHACHVNHAGTWDNGSLITVVPLAANDTVDVTMQNAVGGSSGLFRGGTGAGGYNGLIINLLG